MIPVTVMVSGTGTVSFKIKGSYGVSSPSRFSSYLRPVVFWNITYRCNLRCAHCYLRAGPEGLLPELSREELLRIADQLVELKVPLVIFTGGEPLIRKDFWVVAERLSRSERPKLSLSTNGTLITRSVAKRLKDLGFQYIGISIDSVDPETHDRFRGVQGAFKAAIEGIRNVLSEDMSVGIRMTLTRWNIDEVDKMVDFAVELGVKRLSLYLLDTIGRASELKEDLPTKEQLRRFSSRIVELARRYSKRLEILVVRGNFLGIYIAERLSRSKEEFIKYLKMLEAQGDCGRKTISIYPDGTVRPCQFIDQVVIGNLKHERLSEILSVNNPRLRPFLEVHKMLRGPRCSRCPFRRICGGGSRNRALVLNNDFWGDDPLCIVDYDKIASKWEIKGEI